MKVGKWLVVFMTLLITMGLAACTDNKSAAVDNQEAENFLASFFTAENTDAYDKMMKARQEALKLQDTALVAEAETLAAEDYYADYKDMFTGEGYQLFVLGNHLFNFHTIVKENGYSFKVQDVRLVTPDQGETFDFEVDVTVMEKDTDSKCSVVQTGQLALNEDNKIAMIKFYNMGELYEPKMAPSLS